MAENTAPTNHFEHVQHLAREFRALDRRRSGEPLSITRLPDSNDVALPINQEFCEMAAEAGKILTELPEHWRHGIHPRTMRNADPAKRWSGALFDFSVSGLIDVPNWDEAERVERVDAAASASTTSKHNAFARTVSG